jgi:hypothetical protein
MVIMARSLSIPARFATGFLAQPPDENGIQQIYQLNAHSWAEVYFAGYGWVEFEPTAAFPTQGATSASPEFQPAQPPTFSNGGPLALPPAVESGSSSILTNGYFLVILALFMAAVGIMIWIMRGRHVEQDLVLGAYGRLHRSANWIGQPTPESQTPIEFEATFKNRLTQLTTKSQLARKLIKEGSTSASKFTSLSEEAAQLTDLYIARQYQRRNEAQEAKNDYTADLIWRRIRLRLWLLAVLNKLRRTR